ncbi:hypothetical protein CEQ90_19985 [Lewinellaceae bacterium SD302]|nr:hypothetical protein CEQ90_19985 [Lewinellaceae bacterium SD302]
MNKLLTTSGCKFYIELIVKESKSVIYLVSPYIRLNDDLYERIKEANDRGVKIIVVYGKQDMLTDADEYFKNLSNSYLYYHKNLHAKVYLNESIGLITSMNLYTSSSLNPNRELGVFFKEKDSSSSIYRDALDEVKSIIRGSKKIKLASAKSNKEVIEKQSPRFETLKVSNYYKHDLYRELCKVFRSNEIYWDGVDIVLKIEGNKHIIFSHRIQVPFTDNEQYLKDELRTYLEGCNLNMRLYSNNSRSLTVYNSVENTEIMSDYFKSRIVNDTVITVKSILEFFR